MKNNMKSVNEYNKVLHDFEKKTGYEFKNQALLLQALTHSSYSHEVKNNENENYERLEFFGDAVLEFIISECIYTNCPDMTEGELTKLRAKIVCGSTLASVAQKLNLGSLLRLSKGEESTGGRKRSSILSDALEAVFGAVYLDGGLHAVRDYILNQLNEVIENQCNSVSMDDSKSRLQDIIQKNSNYEISYCVVNETGPDHKKTFTVEAVLLSPENKVIGCGSGHSKKEAEQKAASKALDNIANDKQTI